MKQRILSAALLLCLFIYSPSAAYASPEVYNTMTAFQSQDKFKPKGNACAAAQVFFSYSDRVLTVTRRQLLL